MCFIGKSDIGLKRSSNQDSFSMSKICSNVLLCVVCDGMGGANGGSIASSVAIREFNYGIIKEIKKFVIDDDHCVISDPALISKIITNAAAIANTSVYSQGMSDSELKGMGTTLVASLIVDDIMYIANIGDSRLYIITDNKLKQITTDHSYVRYLVETGHITQAEAAVSPYRNIITRAIGKEDIVETDIYAIKFNAVKPDYIVLCSDGLYNFVHADDICVIVTDTGLSLEERANMLINNANHNGGGDNITVVLIQP